MKKTFCYYIIFTLFFLEAINGQAFTKSVNNHYILKNNKPFIWIGDTAWELFHRLNKEEADFYLKKRAEQGFTLIQAVALAEMDGLNTPNALGQTPLLNNNPSTPNEAYFEHVDFIIKKADEYGLNIGFLPTWGDKIFKSTWGKGPEVFNVENAKLYGKWLGNRYKNFTNIIWILGGDRNPRIGTTDIELWDAMAAGIAEGVGNQDSALISYHSQPNAKGSSEWFHTKNWFDFNMFQTGHCRDSPTYQNINVAYLEKNAKPVIDGEPIYEDHPVCFNANDLGTSNAYDVRKSAYFALFSGAFGHTYGCHDIWQMYSDKNEGVNNPHLFWQRAMDLPGANQMKHVRKLLEMNPFELSIPDQSLIVENNLNASQRIQATKARNYAYVYSAAGLPFHIKMDKFVNKQITSSWYNPKNGQKTFIEIYANKGLRKFIPPKAGYGNDWILILETMAKQ